MEIRNRVISMRETDQFVKAFVKHYDSNKFLRLEVIRNKGKDVTTMYIEQSSGKMICCKKSHKIFEMKLLSNQELKRFMDDCLDDLPISKYDLNVVD